MSRALVSGRSAPRRSLAAVALGLLILIPAASALAQEPIPTEEPDPTRLDVERLPVEAIQLNRDLYSHGFFVESHLGARTFIGGAGRYSKMGFFASLGFGVEIFRWLWVKVSAEGSIHRTDAPAPPSPGVFEVVGFTGELRFQINFTARVALWAGGEVGMLTATGDILQAYGLTDAGRFGLMFGGQSGLDWHMKNRHHSLGIAGGGRLYLPLEGPDGEVAIGIHGTAYLRYVF